MTLSDLMQKMHPGRTSILTLAALEDERFQLSAFDAILGEWITLDPTSVFPGYDRMEELHKQLWQLDQDRARIELQVSSE